jgi:phage shock protein PspC (stress-responsive transcriptional regulator)
MTSQTSHELSAAGDDDPLGQAVRAVIAPPRHASRVAALRTGVLRRPDHRVLGGVCAALAAAWGMPVRLVRAEMVLLALLGVGLVLYPVLVLALPGQVPPGERGRHGGEEDPEIRRGVGLAGNALLVLAGLAAVVVAGWWIAILIRVVPILLVVLVPLTVVIGVVIAVGGLRAVRARQAYLLGELVRRAGIADEEELDRILRAHRRRAPGAWDAEALSSRARVAPVAGEDPSSVVGSGSPAAPDGAGIGTAAGDGGGGPTDLGSAGGAGPHGRGPHPRGRQSGGGRPDRSRGSTDPAQARWSLLCTATLLVAIAVPLGVLTLWPGIVARIADGMPLPQVFTAGITAAVVALVAGVLLIVGGRHGRRSRWTGVAGVMALVMVLGTTAWTRVIDPEDAEPVVMRVTEYQPGYSLSCPESGSGSWARPVVIDLRDLRVTTSAKKADRIWRAENGVSGDVPRSELMDSESYPDYDLTMTVWCDRPIGDIEVIVPEDPDTRLYADMGVTVGKVHGNPPQDQEMWNAAVPVLLLQGQIGLGNLTWTKETAS